MDDTRVGGAKRQLSGHPRAWLIACFVLVTGIALSLGGATLWHASENKRDHQQFESTAADVASALQTQMARDVDFVATLRAVLSLEPPISASRFQTWFALLDGAQRQVGSLGTVVVTSVRRADLSSFQARRNASPGFRAMLGEDLKTVAPLPHREHYCLLSAVASLVSLGPVAGALQGDWCNPASPVIGAGAPEFQAATDTAQFLAAPATAYGIRVGFFDVAFYRLRARTSTVAERRRAVRGWIASSFDIHSLIGLAINGNRGLEVSLYHTNPGERPELVGRVGSQPRANVYRQTEQAGTDGTWMVAVRGRPIVHGLSPQAQGILVFLGGTLTSVLLAVLVFVLSRGRARARGLVEEKAGELEHQAGHDSLTGLPNRAQALKAAERMLGRAQAAQLPMVALYVDIDNLAQLNDLLGHATGDECVQVVAERLQRVLGESGTASRVDGDEFVILLEAPMLDPEIRVVAESLLRIVHEPAAVSNDLGRDLSLSVSIGIAYGLHETPETLLSNAQIAQSVAKASGKNQCVAFETAMLKEAQNRVALELDLANALDEQQFFLVYQPIVDLRDGHVKGVEALLRWRHPERGEISPAGFVPLAEESGAIIPIGRWVLDEACRQAAGWIGQDELDISVNVSARQLERDDLIDDVSRALMSSGLEPSRLTIEVTESALMRDATAASRRLWGLKRLGVQIAIDDFGTGYSSMAYLRQFPVDQLKIDRSFVQSMTGSPRSAMLVHTLVRLGKSLELETLAEGIETEEQLAVLRRQKCDSGQGFLFAKPMEADAVPGFVDGTLASRRVAPVTA